MDTKHFMEIIIYHKYLAPQAKFNPKPQAGKAAVAYVHVGKAYEAQANGANPQFNPYIFVNLSLKICLS